jgi:uncharacterized membrane protein YcaP (DUF421 family)
MSYASRRSVVIEHRLQLLGFLCFVSVAIAVSLGSFGGRARIVANTAAIYLLLLLIFRVSGRRTLNETTTFDLVLLLIIGETTQQAMIGTDDTVPGAAIAIVCLVSLDMSIGYLKRVFPAFDVLLEGKPILLIREGQIQHAAMKANGLDEQDLLEAARLSHGLVDMEDVRQAALERDGKISIVPWRKKPE